MPKTCLELIWWKNGAKGEPRKNFYSDILVLTALTTMGICNVKVETHIGQLLSFDSVINMLINSIINNLSASSWFFICNQFKLLIT
jgi:hypothetical protein